MKYKYLKQNILIGLIPLLFFTGCTEHEGTLKEQVRPVWNKISGLKGSFAFFVIGDWGWNGFKYQKEVADAMSMVSDSIEPKFIVTVGDNFQVNGIESTSDPLWMTSFENIYRTPSLLADWYPVLGNHDYKGNTQAEIDYSKISRRWRLESHYYTFVRKVNDSVSVRLIFLDTPPLVSEYYKSNGYPDIKQDTAKQIAWLKDVLSNSKENWKIVFGHHPVFSASKKHGNTPELIAKLKPLFDRYNVQYYFCGHDHDFQHLTVKDKNTNYIVTGTGGDIRPASTDSLSKFSISTPGFSIIAFHADSISVLFADTTGSIIYKTSDKCRRKM